MPICVFVCVLMSLSHGSIRVRSSRVKSGKFRHGVNSDTHLQTLEIQMRRLPMSCFISIFSVCLVNVFFIPITEL